MSLKDEIAGRLCSFRKEELHIKTASKLADILNIGTVTYANYESGKRTFPDSLKLLLWQKFYLNITWLVTGSGSRLDPDVHNLKNGTSRAEVEAELDRMVDFIKNKL